MKIISANWWRRQHIAFRLRETALINEDTSIFSLKNQSEDAAVQIGMLLIEQKILNYIVIQCYNKRYQSGVILGWVSCLKDRWKTTTLQQKNGLSDSNLSFDNMGYHCFLTVPTLILYIPCYFTPLGPLKQKNEVQNSAAGRRSLSLSGLKLYI